MGKIIKVGITGQVGFMGTHLYNYLSLKKEEIALVPFRDEYFQDRESLNQFTRQCDVIVHLAAMNRHPDPQIIYDTNTELVKRLIESLVTVKSKAHILFSSSTQEEKDNLYGASKREGRKLFEEWASTYHGNFTAFIIPNVFGPFGKPYYNSVIATFCHQLTHNEIPEIHVDGHLKLIYIQELVEHFYQKIVSGNKPVIETFQVPHTSENNVSEILEKLLGFKTLYFEQHVIPAFHSGFDRNLFNTFRSYIDPGSYFPVSYTCHEDNRGSFVEVIRLGQGGQVSFSTTHPGITRGNHFHTRKIERFSVVSGEAVIQLRRIGTGEVFEFKLSGKEPAFVDMPVWYTHNLINIGDDELLTIFWINELYDHDDPDTYFEEVVPGIKSMKS